jgi:hypothetical protein
MFLQELLTDIRQKPFEFFCGLMVLLVAAFGAAVKDVASAVFLVFIIISLFYIKQWPQAWRGLDVIEKLFLSGLLLYMAVGLLSYINVTDEYEYIKQIGRYLRFVLIIPVYLLFIHKKLDLTRFLIAGAMLNALLMLVFLLTRRFSLLVGSLIFIAMICAFYAAILSTARGAWLAAPIIVLMLVWYSVRAGTIKPKQLLIAAAALLVTIIITPAKDVIVDRYEQAVEEVSLFYSWEKFDTSVGGRLAMWDVAFKIWSSHPLVGTGPGDYDDELMNFQKMGIYPAIEVHDSPHNIYLNVLASNGIVGLVVFTVAFIILPLSYLYKIRGERNQPERLSGIVLIVAVMIFGLTETWILRAPFIAIFAIYLVALFVPAGKKLRNDEYQ